MNGRMNGRPTTEGIRTAARAAYARLTVAPSERSFAVSEP